MLVEHTIGRLKRYARLADPYDGNAAGFNREFNVITGLVNLNIVGLHGKGSATARAVEDVSRLGVCVHVVPRKTRNVTKAHQIRV